MKKVHQSNIEAASGGGRALHPDVGMRSTDNTSDRTVVMANEDTPTCSIGETNDHADESRSSSPSKTLLAEETESRSSPPSSPEGHTSSAGAVGPSASANTEAPITLAPRGSVFRYFGADDGSFDLLPSVQLQPIGSTFESSVHRNPYTVADMPVASKPNSDDFPLLVSHSLDSITIKSDVPVASEPDPLLFASKEVPVTPPANTELPLHPPILKAHRGSVFAYVGDTDSDLLNAPVLSLSEDSFHTPIPRS